RRAAGGKRHLPLRAQRALKGRWEIDKREETVGFLPLARSRRAGANSTHLGSGHARISSANHRGTDTQCAPLHFSSCQRQILLRVDLLVVYMHLEMQVRAGGVAGVARE